MSLPLSSLAFLPPSVVSAYSQQGISSLFPWQAHCLTTTSAILGHNLVYNAPTSGGKTLISELLIISRYVQTGKKAVFVLPYIAIVGEKERAFGKVMKPAGMKIKAYSGSQGDCDFTRADVAICTIEKANRLLTKAIDDGEIAKIGVVVIDELHMLSDSQRGVVLECLLTKLLFVGGIQIIGMSATLPNSEEIGKWMNADVFQSDFRPVPLQQFAVSQGNVYSSQWEKVRSLPTGKALSILSTEVKSCIIFCPTRALCQKTARSLAKAGENLPESQEVVEKLEKIAGESELSLCVRKGIAFHHSGLTNEEKEVVESGFLQGKIRVTVATSTLAAGVNLPAQRVLVASAKMGTADLPITQYRQMCGRAGRTGFDSLGDSYLFIDSKEVAMALMTNPVPAIKSAIDRHSVTRLALDVISTGLCKSWEAVEKCVGMTLFASERQGNIAEEITQAREFLLENRMAEEGDGKVLPSLLGRAVLGSSLSPEEGLVVFMELERAADCLCLLSDLHVIYLTTPILTSIRPNWKEMLSKYVRATSSPYFLSISSAIGISEDFICRSEVYPPPPLSLPDLSRIRYGHTDTEEYRLLVHTRFYSAMVLLSLNDGRDDTPSKFALDRGSLQSFSHQCSTYLSLLTSFVGRLNWWQYEALFGALRERAAYIDQSDIQPLMAIEGVDAEKARILLGAGLHTVGRVARAPLSFLCTLFSKYCVPNACRVSLDISTRARKRFAAIFLTSKRKKPI